MPAPIWTDGPSRPSAMPLAREMAQQRNLPIAVLSVINPSLRKMAYLVCGMPLPRASGKKTEEQITGDQRSHDGREHAAPSGASGRIHAGGEAPREEDEGYDNESDDRADNEAQGE